MLIISQFEPKCNADTHKKSLYFGAVRRPRSEGGGGEYPRGSSLPHFKPSLLEFLAVLPPVHISDLASSFFRSDGV